DDVEALADRGNLGRLLHVVGELLQIAVELHVDAVADADPFLLDDARLEGGEPVLDPADGGLGLVARADDEAQAELARNRIVVEGEAGRIRAAMLAAIEHVDQRLADFGLAVHVLVANPGDAAHGWSSERFGTYARQLIVRGGRNINCDLKILPRRKLQCRSVRTPLEPERHGIPRG